VQMAEIERMKRESHPMQAKKDLAARIVKDFHSAEAAIKAGENWAKQFQKDEVPTDIPRVEVRFGDVCSEDPFKFKDVLYTMEWPIRVDKLVFKAGFVSSNTEGARKIKEGAVKINGSVAAELMMKLRIDSDIIIRAGRAVKSVHVYV
jgi:tyrosyl-tRNA synthetase